MKLLIQLQHTNHKTMELLEETARALVTERGRRFSKCGKKNFRADYAGWQCDYNVEKHAFEIGAEDLFPELIAVLEDLQELVPFEMHFEHNGARVADNWWRDEEYELYENDGVWADDYYFSKLEEATTPKANLLADQEWSVAV